MSCATPIPDEDLVAYWSAESPHDAQDALEAHLYACDRCTARMTALAKLMDELAAFGSDIPLVVSRAQLAALQDRGTNVEEVSLEPFGRGSMAVAPAVGIVALAIQVSPRGYDRVDVAYCGPDGTVFHLFEDAPVEVGSNEIILACERHIAAAHAEIRFRLIGHAGAERRDLADVSLVNTAFAG